MDAENRSPLQSLTPKTDPVDCSIPSPTAEQPCVSAFTGNSASRRPIGVSWCVMGEHIVGSFDWHVAGEAFFVQGLVASFAVPKVPEPRRPLRRTFLSP